MLCWALASEATSSEHLCTTHENLTLSLRTKTKQSSPAGQRLLGRTCTLERNLANLHSLIKE